MIRIVLGAALAVALQLSGTGIGLAASGGGGGGDGLDRNAAATGNSTFAGQHRGPEAGGRRTMRHHRHHGHHRLPR